MLYYTILYYTILYESMENMCLRRLGTPLFYKLWATLALNMPRCTKVTTTSPQRELGGHQTEPKGAKGRPKGAQGSTKAAQRSPKGSKKTPKRHPKMVRKWIQVGNRQLKFNFHLKVRICDAGAVQITSQKIRWPPTRVNFLPPLLQTSSHFCETNMPPQRPSLKSASRHPLPSHPGEFVAPPPPDLPLL